MKEEKAHRDISYHLCIRTFEILKFFMRLLPSEMMIQLCSRVGAVASMFCKRESETSIVQLQFASFNQHFPAPQRLSSFLFHVDEDHLSSNWAKELVKGAFANLGEVIGEFFIFDRLLEISSPGVGPNQLPKFTYITSTSEQVARRLIDGNKTVVALSAHTGCFELLAAYYAACGAKIAVVGRNPNYSVLSHLLHKLRESYGVTTIWRNDAKAGHQFLRALKNAQVLAVLIDQDTNLENAFVPFFGLPAAFPIGPIRFALRHRLPIITTFIVRTKRLHHHIITEEVPYDPDDPDLLQKILYTYSSRLEQILLQYPKQWVWWHRRWRRRPGTNYNEHPELLRGTNEYLAWLREKLEQKQSGKNFVVDE